MVTQGELNTLHDKRLLYFSTQKGYDQFLDKVNKSKQVTQNLFKTPKIIFDGEIKGPWSKYTYVWRVCLEPTFSENRSEDENYFFF